jgi:predicted DNA-binding transcriptional regulator AlpA
MFLAMGSQEKTKKVTKPSDLISIAEAIREFGIGRGTIFKAMDDGVLKRYRRGGDRSVYLSRKAIVAWRSFKEERVR